VGRGGWKAKKHFFRIAKAWNVQSINLGNARQRREKEPPKRKKERGQEEEGFL